MPKSASCLAPNYSHIILTLEESTSFWAPELDYIIDIALERKAKLVKIAK